MRAEVLDDYQKKRAIVACCRYPLLFDARISGPTSKRKWVKACKLSSVRPRKASGTSSGRGAAQGTAARQRVHCMEDTYGESRPWPFKTFSVSGSGIML